jgi:hypothetical protein
MIYPGFPQQSSQFSPYGGFPLVSQPFYGNRMSVSLNFPESRKLYPMGIIVA